MTVFSWMFLSLVFLGPVVSLSSSSWFLVWGGMELSLIGLLPLMSNDKSNIMTESAFKYFLVQALASLIVLISGINIFMFNSNSMMILGFFLIGLTLKLGIFPLHFWVIPVLKTSGYNLMMLLLGPMKIVPLSLLMKFFQVFNISNFSVLWFAVFSALIGAIIGNNVSSIRAVLGASSISHSGWFMVGAWSGGMWSYFFIYLISLFLMLWYLEESFSKVTALLILALSGLPPFLLFFGKVNILLSFLTVNASLLFLVILIISAVLSLNFYLKFSYIFYLKEKKLGFTGRWNWLFFLSAWLVGAFLVLLF
uniref:NADH-ubiquinone oxidoreductase chain 2 n=1 Tax=Vertigo pusilla TaxID=1282417 RepID=A0A0A6ZAI0_9EUPU|nr:NADH dehydrogenase subunit 2 [Vertigo pusilla]AGC52888.1 NADH dehydrogenase subunit 2 [Vertigo pusilla]